MKNIYTLFTLLAVSSVASAQWKVNPEIQEVQQPVRVINDLHEITQNTADNRGDWLWSDDFSDPSAWDTEVLYGDFGWTITSTETGWFFGTVINSLSDGNYAFVWNDNPIENPTPLPGQYLLTTANPIDVSGIEAASLQYNLRGARFTDTLKVQVSTDGMNFTTVGNHQDIAMLTANGGAATANSIVREYNITLNVQGADQIWVRFDWQGDIAYGWMIDDVRLVEPLAHDLRIAEFWTGDIIFDYEYTMMPVAQSQPKVVGASFRNYGASIENASLGIEIFQEGVVDPVFTGESDAITLSQGDLDTIWFDTGFTPLDIAEYTVEFEVISADGDLTPEDNTGSKPFMITDYLWANDDYNASTATFNGTLGTGTSTETEFILGTAFAVYEPNTFFEGCQFRLASGTTMGQEVAAALYIFGASEIEPVVESFTYYTLQSGDQTGEVNLGAEDPIELEVGSTYLMTLQHFPGDETLVVRGSEGDNDFSSYLYGDYGTGGVAWYTYTDFSPAIRLGIDGFVGLPNLSKEEMAALLQNFPNPFEGNTVIPYSLTQAERVQLEIFDITGKRVMEIEEGLKPQGRHQVELNAAALQSGIYFYTLTAGQTRLTKKMTVK